MEKYTQEELDKKTNNELLVIIKQQEDKCESIRTQLNNSLTELEEWDLEYGKTILTLDRRINSHNYPEKE